LTLTSFYKINYSFWKKKTNILWAGHARGGQNATFFSDRPLSGLIWIFMVLRPEMQKISSIHEDLLSAHSHQRSAFINVFTHVMSFTEPGQSGALANFGDYGEPYLRS